ncbi:hypothetical protein SDC9_193573 [bioreactor metagenome]|uniref:Uncharacterized protein n=1 Tax=bioreactor metagenome TaxID=1076179 RepID=A0A645ICH8_9ZZZZ
MISGAERAERTGTGDGQVDAGVIIVRKTVKRRVSDQPHRAAAHRGMFWLH